MTKKTYKDPSLSPEERARLLLGEMSLEEKMGQVVGYNPMHWDPEYFKESYPQGCGQVSLLGACKARTIEEAAAMQREIQGVVMSLSDHHIPAFFHAEALTGVMLADCGAFATGIGQGATWDVQLQEEMADIIGQQARAAGAAQVFAPVLDVAVDPRFGRTGESYGEDPTLCAAMGSAYVRGLQKGDEPWTKPLATAKHFLGFHSCMGGIHGASCDIPERKLREIYAKPFQAAITEAGLQSVMSSYGTINGKPAAGSRKILTDLLRHEMGMDGYVVADYNAVADLHGRMKMAQTPEEAGRMSMEAGMDCELPFRVCFNDKLKEAIQAGRFNIEYLDQAVYRALKLKFQMGLFEHPYAADDKTLVSLYKDPKVRAVEERSARESIVLLKNDGILPLDHKPRRIAVIGHHAGSTRAMFGGYSYVSMTEGELGAENTMAGVKEDPDLPLEVIIRQIIEKENQKPKYPGSLVKKEEDGDETFVRERIPGSENLISALKRSCPEAEIIYEYGYPFTGNDTSGFDRALRAAERADLVILTLGTKYATGFGASEGEGIDTIHIGLPECQELFLKEYKALNKPTIAIHFGGRPISSDQADACANALLEAWNPGIFGPKALADILFGEYNPGGKLPVSVAAHTGQVPQVYNHLNGSSYHQGMGTTFVGYVNCGPQPRYYFGYGLSYTQFQYSDLKIEKEDWNPYEIIEISCNVENTGRFEGDEVVQLYSQDLRASMARPNMELQGFVRVHLLPGQKKKVLFRMKLTQLAFLDDDMRWKVEMGEFNFMVAAASNDIRLEKTIRVVQDGIADGKTRGFYAATEVSEV